MPVWANWTAETFVGAWVQRLVAAVQVSNAQCVLSALSRVGAGVASSCIILFFACVFLRLLFCGLVFENGIFFCCVSVSCFFCVC